MIVHDWSTIPFLFLLAPEGLIGLVHKRTFLGLFKGLKINKDIHFKILQFSYNTMILGEETWINLWSLKAIIHGFELVLGLCVNMYKNMLYGIKLKDNFIHTTFSLLSCCIDSIPFMFLGIPVGVNLRRRSTWNLVISKLRCMVLV